MDNSKYNCFLSGNEDKSFSIIDGINPIVLSAPHNVKHLRHGNIKYREPQTGRLVYDLATALNVNAIIKTAFKHDDANFDLACLYKDELSHFIKAHDIKLLLDFHQMSPKRPENFDIGIADGQNLIGRIDIYESIRCSLQAEFSLVETDKNFPAKYFGTVSRYVSEKTQIPCLQLEINSRLLNTPSYDKVFLFFKGWITKVREIL